MRGFHQLEMSFQVRAVQRRERHGNAFKGFHDGDSLAVNEAGEGKAVSDLVAPTPHNRPPLPPALRARVFESRTAKCVV